MKKTAIYDLNYLKQSFVQLVSEQVVSSRTNQSYEFLKLKIKTDVLDISVNIQNYTEFEQNYLKNIVYENDYVIYKKRKQFTERTTGNVIDYDVICISRAEPNVNYLEEFVLKLDSTTKQLACSLLNYIEL